MPKRYILLVLYELVEERQANEKQFRMSDGSVVVSMFDTAVHYEDGGTWKVFV